MPFKKRIFHEISFWSQTFDRIINGRLWSVYKVWRKQQKVYFSKVPDINDWSGSNFIEGK